MSAKKHKRARAMAYRAAKHQDLWAKAEQEVKKSFWRRLSMAISKRVRSKWTTAIGRWYKATLKRWAHDFYERERAGEFAAFEKARRKVARERKTA
jgi:hypothetical protein